MRVVRCRRGRQRYFRALRADCRAQDTDKRGPSAARLLRVRPLPSREPTFPSLNSAGLRGLNRREFSALRLALKLRLAANRAEASNSLLR